MNLIKKTSSEISFTLEFTESELGTLYQALGGSSYGGIRDSNGRFGKRTKILNSCEQSELYEKIQDLFD